MYPRDTRGVMARLASESTAIWEILGSLPWRRKLARSLPAGDGHPVVLIPGFTATERTMGQLARFLGESGYVAHGWGLGRNTSVNQVTLERLQNTVSGLALDSGRKVSVIGWSGGGLYARGVANLIPDSVRQVITLGTPFKMTEDTLHYLPEAISRLHDRLKPAGDDTGSDITGVWGEAPPVPSTSVYSERDALAPWPFCLDHRDAQSENIHVSVSHTSMPFNALVYYIIADRLSQTEWRPFNTSALRRVFYRHACATEMLSAQGAG